MVMNFLLFLPGERLSCVYSYCRQAGVAASHTAKAGTSPYKGSDCDLHHTAIQEWGRREHNRSCLG